MNLTNKQAIDSEEVYMISGNHLRMICYLVGACIKKGDVALQRDAETLRQNVSVSRYCGFPPEQFEELREEGREEIRNQTKEAGTTVTVE